MPATARKKTKKKTGLSSRAHDARAGASIKPRTKADKVIAFIEKYLRIPDGMNMGQPVVLEEFQKEFIRKIWDNPAGTRRAIFSAGRKNAKTAIIAMIVLACLVGPLAIENSQIESGAMSRDQASKVFEYANKMAAMSPDIKPLIHPIPSHKTLLGLPLNTSYRAMSAEATTAHGGSPRVVIMDELGQVVGPRSDFFDAMVTSQGAHKDPLLIVISTQAANDADLLSILIDDAKSGVNPRNVCVLYTAPDDCDLMDEKAWRAANPAMGKFLSETEIRDQAEEAVRLPSTESRFRNLVLNQRVVATSPLISKSSWREVGDSKGRPMVALDEADQIFGGLDLSGRTDLTSLVLLGETFDDEGNAVESAHAFFWTPEKGLLERTKRDRAPYDLWVKQGYIKTTPGASIDYEAVARDIAEIVEPLLGRIKCIAFDRWRIDILKKELERIGLELPLEAWGQGFKDMAPAVEALEAKVLNKTLRHDHNPVLTMCMANAVVTKDPAGGRKLDKSKTTGRIDGAQALTMACGIADRLMMNEGNFSDFVDSPLVL